MEERARSIRRPSTAGYFKKAVPFLLIVSVLTTAVFQFGRLDMPFAVEMLQVVVFVLLVDMVMRGDVTNGSIQDHRTSNRARLKSFTILSLCALAAFGISLLATRRIGTMHAIYPMIFPMLVTTFGGKLATANGRRVERVLTDPTMRFLTTASIAVAFFLAGFAFSISLWRSGFFNSAPYAIQLLALTLEMFIQLLPFAVYALVLRRSFVLEGDDVSPTEDA